jgi:hypothetical protein
MIPIAAALMYPTIATAWHMLATTSTAQQRVQTLFALFAVKIFR